jgi:hypothetical protein
MVLLKTKVSQKEPNIPQKPQNFAVPTEYCGLREYPSISEHRACQPNSLLFNVLIQFFDFFWLLAGYLLLIKNPGQQNPKASLHQFGWGHN